MQIEENGMQTYNSFYKFIKILSEGLFLLGNFSIGVAWNLNFSLEIWVSIPSDIQCLLFEGMKLDDFFPFSMYKIENNGTIFMVFNLKWGWWKSLQLFGLIL